MRRKLTKALVKFKNKNTLLHWGKMSQVAGLGVGAVVGVNKATEHAVGGLAL